MQHNSCYCQIVMSSIITTECEIINHLFAVCVRSPALQSEITVYLIQSIKAGASRSVTIHSNTQISSHLTVCAYQHRYGINNILSDRTPVTQCFQLFKLLQKLKLWTIYNKCIDPGKYFIIQLSSSVLSDS